MNKIDNIMSEAEHAYFKEDNLEKVLQLTKEAIEIDSTDIRPLNLMGVVLFEKGLNKESITCFDKILDLDPSYNDAKLKKGQVLTELGKYDEAQDILDHLIDNEDDIKDEAIIAKLSLCIENGNEKEYQDTLKVCRKRIAEKNSKYLKDELKFIESIHNIMDKNKKR